MDLRRLARAAPLCAFRWAFLIAIFCLADKRTVPLMRLRIMVFLPLRMARARL